MATGVETTDGRAGAASHSALSFRPDIEGMRAVAIALVLCDHLDIPGFSGGFIGVDVFFVISGFLITSLLAAEYSRNLAAGTGRLVSIRGFYARRARRILPASLVVIAATLLITKLTFNPLRFAEVQVDALWATFFAANIQLMEQATDYFAQGISVSPLQNYWSLAVEEQFYLVWPALFAAVLWAIAKLRARAHAFAGNWRGWTLCAVIAIVIGSFGWSVVATNANPAPAYFSPFTRGWELALGAAIALSAGGLGRIGRAGRESLALAGLGMIIGGLFVIDPSTAYPGAIALLPVLGASALIVSGLEPTGPSAPIRSADGNPGTAVGAMLSVRPVRFLGRVSYSLYLWHWPIIVVLLTLHPAAMQRTGIKAMVAAGCVLVAWLSYLAIEEPFRRVKTIRPKRGAPRMAVAWMAVVAAIALVPIAAYARPTTSSRELLADANARLAVLGGTNGASVSSLPPARWRRELAVASRTKRAGAAEMKLIVGAKSLGAGFACLSITGRADARRCTRAGTAARSSVRWPSRVRRSVVLYGNSHAGHWDSTLLSALPPNVTLHTLTRPGCHITTRLDDPARTPDGRSTCGSSNRFLLDQAKRARPGLVVLSAMGSTPPKSVLATARHFRALGAKVLWISFSPLARGFNKCLAGSNIWRCQGPLFKSELESAASARALASAYRLEYFNLIPFLCDSNRCPPLLRGVPIRSDGNHLSLPVLERLRPYLVREVNRALARR